ncbi:MAG: hypothetical protein M1819_004819 [Sarea resinae]|nr:MAG: hypothetical protein M1819_004819 [Sarea resinae]
MPRNAHFTPHHEPLVQVPSLELRHRQVSGPFSFFNPTRAHFRHVSRGNFLSSDDEKVHDLEERAEEGDEQLADNIGFKWRARDNRKGRHTLVVDPVVDSGPAHYIVPPKTTSLRAILKGCKRMLTQYPYWNISWLVAVIFTWGSIIWVINAFFVWLPLVRPSSEFPDESYTAGGVTAFVGATVFELGSILLMFEAVNENRSGCFGWALEQVVQEHSGEKGRLIRVRPDMNGCTHHHTNKRNLVGRSSVMPKSTKHTSTSSSSSPDPPPSKPDASAEDGRSWVWFPSWYELRTHYLREMGFLASLAQFLGATIFWISGFTALPNVVSQTDQPLLDGVFWTPQVVGGTGFIISGVLFMLETQPKWYVPALGTLGWHIGFWNFIGAIGFTLCGALGYSTNSGADYEANLATFWGSWAFLIGSVIQWYEAMDQNPVEEKKGASSS